MKPLIILLADDDIDDCIFFKAAVDEFPLSTDFTAVHDGEELMQLLLDQGRQLPDLVFLDINMPRKNGFECLSEIKLSDKLKHLPVIMFSTSLEQGVVNRLYESGAQYFVRKPPGFIQFKSIIQQTLGLMTREDVPKSTRETFVIVSKTLN